MLDTKLHHKVAVDSSYGDRRQTSQRRVLMVVDVLHPAAGRSVLVASAPDRTLHHVSIATSADESTLAREIPSGTRPVAIRCIVEDEAVSCSAIVASVRGPKRISLTTPAALALMAAGVHGIVSTRDLN